MTLQLRIAAPLIALALAGACAAPAAGPSSHACPDVANPEEPPAGPQRRERCQNPRFYRKIRATTGACRRARGRSIQPPVLGQFFSVEIQASADLRNWAPVATNAPSPGPLTFTDATAADDSVRFYRTLILP